MQPPHRRTLGQQLGDPPSLLVRDPIDIAAVASVALTEPGYEGAALTLSGPEPLTPGEQVAALAAALRRPLRYQPLTDDGPVRAWRPTASRPASSTRSSASSAPASSTTRPPPPQCTRSSAAGLTGQPQWFTMPLGAALLAVAVLLRSARRAGHRPVATPDVIFLEVTGMGLIVGASLV
jgi:hypothetical protein